MTNLQYNMLNLLRELGANPQRRCQRATPIDTGLGRGEHVSGFLNVLKALQLPRTRTYKPQFEHKMTLKSPFFVTSKLFDFTPLLTPKHTHFDAINIQYIFQYLEQLTNLQYQY